VIQYVKLPFISLVAATVLVRAQFQIMSNI